MIIQNLVDDFYRKLSPSRNVLILCGLDVDALAATSHSFKIKIHFYFFYIIKCKQYNL